MRRVAAIIGGGVIGGGWAARFALHGWEVRVFDPDPEAERKLAEVLANARRSLPGLYDTALPPEGRIRIVAKMSEAVEDAAWIQESVPERLDLKRKVFQTLHEHSSPDAVIGSSTSGFKPSELQGCASIPDRIVVAHPFNPVYLIPLVELVTTDRNPPEVIDAAKSVLSDIGAVPLHITREIDAHIADRLLEAVWREALWLINDGIATTEQIDEAIRLGFGLRWAQMGLFETYRIAGGEEGMTHFLEQFGPALKWPWTKLMDVPDLTPDLIARITDQSNAQSGDTPIRDLERRRDANLVAILRGLKVTGQGAGAHLKAADRARQTEAFDTQKPNETSSRTIPLDWTDYNGHMTEARYLDAFAAATDRFMELVGCDADYIASGGSFFTAETHIRHLSELHAGDVIRIETQVLGAEGKKMHLFHKMWSGDTLAATGEHLLLHVSLETRRTSPPAGLVAERLSAVALGHSRLDIPEGAGRAVGGSG